MIALVKFLHIAAIAIWAAGLVALPGLYVQRAKLTDKQSLYNLQTLVRFAYVAIISPAAFVSVVTGILLIFGQQTFVAWFSLKLAFVAMLVVLHVLTGLVIIRLFRDGEIYPVWRFVLVTIVTIVVVVTILFVVLAKPNLENTLPAVLSQPGGLAELLAPINPWRTP